MTAQPRSPFRRSRGARQQTASSGWVTSESTPGRSRVLFLCAKLDNGGAERHWANLLPALVGRGVSVRLVAIQGGGRALAELRTKGIPIRELGKSGLSSLAALPALMGERNHDPTVLVTFGYNAHAVGAAFALLTGTPHVVNWHRQSGWPMNLVERSSVRLAARAGAAAISVTGAQSKDLRQLGFASDRVRVVPNGVSAPSHDGDSRDTLRKRLGLPSDGFLVALVARLRPEKRIADFVDAITRASKVSPRLLGLVVGDGELETELRVYAERRRAPILFVGHDSDPSRWMLAADVVGLTSAFEALPMSLVEALACGRPCVATDVGGTREIVEDGLNGLVVPPGDVALLTEAITNLYEQPRRCQQMGALSLAKWRSTFSFDAMVTAYAGLLGSAGGLPISWRDV